jgi:hypothetical protein
MGTQQARWLERLDRVRDDLRAEAIRSSSASSMVSSIR